MMHVQILKAMKILEVRISQAGHCNIWKHQVAATTKDWSTPMTANIDFHMFFQEKTDYMVAMKETQ